MKRLNLLFIGFGIVGRGLAELLLEKEGMLKSRFDLEVKTVGICDLRWGTIVNDDGINLSKALKLVNSGKALTNYDSPAKRDLTSLEAIRETTSNVVVEATWTNIETGEPGLTHIREALKLGKHVATTNKGPIALAYKELISLAKVKGAQLRFEGTVMSGTPTFNLKWSCLAAAEVRRIVGILNGTTNFILTEMEKGLSYEEALHNAQELGYAEADPTLDVDGWDAAIKAVILANVLMDGNLSLKDVKRRGIRGISLEEVLSPIKQGCRLKLLVEVRRERSDIVAKVDLTPVPTTSILAGVSGPLNAMVMETDVLGDVTIIGPGAGRRPTGYALLNDILEISKHL
ncbi:MAG: homoserine dehydrogenase [Candidatus Nezhaarchaeales archaeon]|nr:MAG: homoserine dehydrogenase [Candidatus Nezhaarchaeota archaeon WYZ-LMO8]TDA36852.1 MAG: homoserine dehydrogenase [Candidatus Nezhaarchaeota archaeon WYZ-LMO7]